MSAVDRDSGLDITIRPMPEGTSVALGNSFKSAPDGKAAGSADDLDRQAAEQGILLNGEVLACPCPDCGAPMSIRLWLMLADCWRCGSSIELTEQQERIARQLLDRQQKKSPPAEASPAAASQPMPPALPSRTGPSQTGPSQTGPSRTEPARRPPPTAPPIPLQRKTEPAPERRRSHRTATARATSAGTVSSWLAGLLKNLPAWLISFLLHVILIIILGLWNLGDDDEGPFITLSTDISMRIREGAVDVPIEKTDEPDLDLPAELPRDGPQREALILANQQARELRLDPRAQQQLPEISRVRSALNSSDPSRRMLAARDPRLRSEIVKDEGGTLWTEAAVARGLRWLSKHQNDDGSWSLNRFHQAGDCNGRCDGRGQFGKMAGTSLALLPFLGAGQSPSIPCKYRDVVAKGLRWILEHQDKKTGDLRGDTGGNGGMYVHGQAAIVLCEAFALTSNETLRSPAQRALDFIVKAQHPAGGWRYRPGQPGDTSVLGWQLMALHSGKSATLTVADHTLKLTAHYLRSAQARGQKGLYGYMPGNAATEAMTAEALLCRFYLGDKKDAPGLTQGIDYLVLKHLPNGRRPNMYYWYYATQVMHHWGGTSWVLWNRRMRDVLISSQETHGHRGGSWLSRGRHDGAGGRLYSTALAICTLEVYYRHAPLFKQIDLK